MPTLIVQPPVIKAAGHKPKRIEEFAGRVNSGHATLSVARMVSPQGWLEPGQRPEFEEVTVVLNGLVRVEYEGGVLDVRAGPAVVTHAGELVRYSTPGYGSRYRTRGQLGAKNFVLCFPAFSPKPVRRADEQPWTWQCRCHNL